MMKTVEQRQASGPPAGPHSRAGASVAGACVLVVDDDKSLRETIADLLELSGFHPLKACDASEALMVLRRERDIDALITDLTMPGEDGITLIRMAREIKANLPAILLTGYAEKPTEIVTAADGIFHILRKPVEGERLIQQLRLLVTGSALK